MRRVNDVDAIDRRLHVGKAFGVIDDRYRKDLTHFRDLECHHIFAVEIGVHLFEAA